MKKFRNFEIHSELPRRGHGRAFLAIQTDLGREVILKILPRPGAKALARFRKEAEILTKVQVLGIHAVHEFGCEGDVFFFAQEVQSGRSLGDWLGGRLDARRTTGDVCYALEEIVRVCEALDAIHAHGLVHRDLRPGNILVDESGQVKISDFGLARFWNDQSMSRREEKFGDSTYLSPEQITGSGRVDFRSDIFTVGVILFELLTGRHPFSGGSRKQTEENIKFGNRHRLHQIDATLPRDLDRILGRVLERNPDDRYIRAGEFAADLRRYLAGEKIEARRAGSWQRWGSKVSRNRIVAAGILGLAVLLPLTISYQNRQAKHAFETLHENGDDLIGENLDPLARLKFAIFNNRGRYGDGYNEIMEAGILEQFNKGMSASFFGDDGFPMTEKKLSVDMTRTPRNASGQKPRAGGWKKRGEPLRRSQQVDSQARKSVQR